LEALKSVFVRNVDVVGAPKLLIKRGPKKAAVVVEMVRTKAIFTFADDINTALDV